MKLSALCACAASLFLISCASSERMMRVSPFESPSANSDNNFGNNVNLWPAYYRNQGFTSVCWPMIDHDAQGMAIRPFYNHDKDEYSILFPFSAWNPQKKDGWAFNTYWTDDYCGSVPLFHLGKASDINYVMPVWWKRGAVFYCGMPATCFSKKLNFVGPLWTDFTSPASGGIFPIYQQKADSGWLFPIYDYDNSPSETDLKMLFGTLGRYYRNADNDSHYRFVTGFYVDRHNKHYQGFIPLYYYHKLDQGKDNLLLTPLAGYGWDSNTNSPYFRNLVGPLYIESQSPERNFRSFMFPLYIQINRKDSDTIASVPLFWIERQKEDLFVLAGGPLYIYNHKQGNTTHDLVWPLCQIKSNSTRLQWYMWPVINYNNDIPAIFMLEPDLWAFCGPFGAMYSSTPEKKLIWTALLFTYQQYQKQTGSMTQTEHFEDFHNQQVELQSENKMFTGWFYSNSSTYQALNSGVKHGSIRDLRNELSRLKTALQITSPNYHDAANTKTVTHWQKQLAETLTKIPPMLQELKLNYPMPQTPEECDKLLARIDQDCFHMVRYNRYMLPLFYDYQALGQEYQWNVFWFLANGEKISDNTRTSILKYGYRRETFEGGSNTIIFPFINWKTGKDRFRFSFLWRLYEYERNQDKVKGHIFFFPY